MKWTHPYFRQISQFGKYHDACGPASNEMALACLQRRTPSTQRADIIRERDIKAGFWSSNGQTVRQLIADVERFEPGIKVTLWPRVVDYGPPTYDPVVNYLKVALERRHVCVLNVGNAGALPGNERNVRWHFVAVGGIDGDTYYIGNGDESPQDFVPNWITREQLIGAMPVAVVEYEAVGGEAIFSSPGQLGFSLGALIIFSIIGFTILSGVFSLVVTTGVLKKIYERMV